jgi:hypothetical protein
VEIALKAETAVVETDFSFHSLNVRANIVQNLYYGKCTGKRDFTLQNFLFQQNM